MDSVTQKDGGMVTQAEILAAAEVIEMNIIDSMGRRLTPSSARRLAELILTAAEKVRVDDAKFTIVSRREGDAQAR
jgi:hypothetical protein